ncbi:MAG: hypothetical protein ACYC7D_06505 [Nitrososphaerales archaeon]
MDAQKFERDLAFLASRACQAGDYDKIQSMKIKTNLDDVRFRLLDLYRRNMVKINHSAMELLCAKKLVELSYDKVNVEHSLKENLVCDLLGENQSGSAIVEIETGFASPEYALQPLTYSKARIASKLARYSAFSKKFILGTTPTNVLQIPGIFLVPPELRGKEEVVEIKALCDLYYKNPQVSLDEIIGAKVDSVFIIDVDRVDIEELGAESYCKRAQEFLKK